MIGEVIEMDLMLQTLEQEFNLHNFNYVTRTRWSLSMMKFEQPLTISKRTMLRKVIMLQVSKHNITASTANIYKYFTIHGVII